MSSNYIVTGSAGFIGARVARMLMSDGNRVTGIDDLNDGYDPRLKKWRLARLEAEEQFRFHRVDIRDGKALAQIFAADKFDALLNLGQEPECGSRWRTRGYMRRPTTWR